MNKNNTPAISVTQFVFLMILGIAIFFVITVFRGPGQAGPGLTQVSTPSETNSPTLTPSPSLTANPAYPGPESTQTVAAAVTRKASLYATYLASSPEVSTQALYPTGIFNDPNIYDTGRKLFIDATNEYGGYLNGKRFTLFAGALLDDPQQGLVYFFYEQTDQNGKISYPYQAWSRSPRRRAEQPLRFDRRRRNGVFLRSAYRPVCIVND